MPPPLQVDLGPFDFESGVRVTCDVGYLCANFSLPRPLCSRLRPDLRGRQTSDAHHRFLIPPLWGREHNYGVVVVEMNIIKVALSHRHAQRERERETARSGWRRNELRQR